MRFQSQLTPTESRKFPDLVVTDFRKAALQEEARARGVLAYQARVEEIAEALGVFVSKDQPDKADLQLPLSMRGIKEELEAMLLERGMAPVGGKARMMKDLGLTEAVRASLRGFHPDPQTLPRFEVPDWAVDDGEKETKQANKARKEKDSESGNAKSKKRSLSKSVGKDDQKPKKGREDEEKKPKKGKK